MKVHEFFFFLLLVFLPTQLGFHFWPEWAMVLGRRVDYLSPTVFFTDILVILLLITWFFGHHKKFSVKPLFLFFSFIAINIFFASRGPVAMYTWIKVLEFVCLGWYIIQTKPKFSFIVSALSFGVFYSSFLAITQFFLQHSIGGPFWFLGERTFSVDTPGIARINWGRELLRPYATFPHPNVLGGYIAAILPLLLWQKPQIFYKATMFLGCVALFLTFSRSAWVVAVVGISLVNRKFFLPLLILLVFLIFQFNVNEESVVVRQQLNAAAISIWQQSPLFGVGLGNFLVELPRALVSREVYFLQPVHNIYLLLLAETGIVGLGIFLWLIWFVIHKKKIFSIWHLPFGILLVLGLVDHYPITLQQGQLLLTILAALSLSARSSN